jgi:hypothetical protein
MCEPTTIMTAASLAMAAVSAVGGGVAQKKQADFQSAQMENAAKVEEIRADQALEQSAQEQRKFDREAALKTGQQNALMAASGLNMGTGSLLNASVDNARELALDRQNLAFGGQTQAWGHQNQSGALQGSAANTRLAGRNAMTAGFINAGASILGGAGSMMGSADSPLKLAKKTGLKNLNLKKF